jgi:predicted transglutaminase-like cysteine proteinase
MSACHAPPIGANPKPDGVRAQTGWRSVPDWLRYLVLFTIGVSVALATTLELGFSRSVTRGLVEHFAARYGPDSRKRISGWQEFVGFTAAGRRLPGNDVALLGAVNIYFNRLPFVTDQAHWGVEDYWATPPAAIASNGADCRDFSIAKYFALKGLGVPSCRIASSSRRCTRMNWPKTRIAASSCHR